MQGQMTYRKAKKLNSVFLLLLLATDEATNGSGQAREEKKRSFQKQVRSPEYFDQMLKEFESNKIRF